MHNDDPTEHDLSFETESKQFLFLAGTGRSGTSILRRSLGMHSEIYYNGHENNIVQDIAEVALKNCTLESRTHAMVVTQTDYDAAFRRLVVSLIWPDPELRKRPFWMAAINPSNEILGYLNQLFPQAKIVGLVRNGIEVINSRMKYPSFANAEFSHHCDAWLRSKGVIEWGQAHPDQFRLFRHDWTYGEELHVRFSELFDWLKISECDAVAENISNVIAHPTSDTGKEFGSMSPEEKQSYFQAKTSAWQAWSPDQRNEFRIRCAALMKQLDYPLPF